MEEATSSGPVPTDTGVEGLVETKADRRVDFKCCRHGARAELQLRRPHRRRLRVARARSSSTPRASSGMRASPTRAWVAAPRRRCASSRHSAPAPSARLRGGRARKRSRLPRSHEANASPESRKIRHDKLRGRSHRVAQAPRGGSFSSLRSRRLRSEAADARPRLRSTDERSPGTSQGARSTNTLIVCVAVGCLVEIWVSASCRARSSCWPR